MAIDATKGDAGSYPEDAVGTGIYWFTSPAGVMKMFAPRIRRSEARALAQNLGQPGPQVLDSYRWVPEAVERPDTLVTTICSGAQCTSDIHCRDNACKCINGICQ